MKKICAVIIMLVVITLSVLCPSSTHAQVNLYTQLFRIYSLSVIVVDVEKTDNQYIVSCQDNTGEAWAFYDSEDTWHNGDTIYLLMLSTDVNNNSDNNSDNNSNNKTDKIIMAYMIY